MLFGLMKRQILTYTHKEQGANLVEYALLISLVAGLSVVVLTSIGREMADIFCYTAGKTMTGDAATADAAQYGGAYDWDQGCCVAKKQDGSLGDGGCL